MTLFPIGVIWLALLLFSCLYNIKYTAILLLISYVLQGACFLETSGFLIKIFEVSSLFFISRFLLILLRRRRVKLNKSARSLVLFWVISIFITVLSGIVFSGLKFSMYRVSSAGILMTVGTKQIALNENIIGPLLRLGLAVLVFIPMVNLKRYSNISERDIMLSLKISIWIVTIVGIVQLLNTYQIINLDGIVQLFHYERSNDERMTDSFYRGSVQLYSTFMEASYLAQWIVAVMAYISFSNEWKLKNLYIVILLIELALSFSATGIVGLASLLIYNAMKKVQKVITVKKLMIYCGFIVGIVLFLCFVPYGQKLIEMVSTKLVSQSGIERMAYVKQSLEAFVKSYGVGVGYLQVQCMTLFAGLLGQVGILGTMAFFRFLISLYKEKQIGSQYKAMLIISTFCNCIASPGLLGHLPMWSVLYYAAISASELKTMISDIKTPIIDARSCQRR